MPAQEEPAHFYGSTQSDKLIRILCAKIIMARGRMKMSPMDEAGYKTQPILIINFAKTGFRAACVTVARASATGWGKITEIAPESG